MRGPGFSSWRPTSPKAYTLSATPSSASGRHSPRATSIWIVNTPSRRMPAGSWFGFATILRDDWQREPVANRKNVSSNHGTSPTQRQSLYFLGLVKKVFLGASESSTSSQSKSSNFSSLGTCARDRVTPSFSRFRLYAWCQWIEATSISNCNCKSFKRRIRSQMLTEGKLRMFWSN